MEFIRVLRLAHSLCGGSVLPIKTGAKERISSIQRLVGRAGADVSAGSHTTIR